MKDPQLDPSMSALKAKTFAKTTCHSDQYYQQKTQKVKFETKRTVAAKKKKKESLGFLSNGCNSQPL